MCELNTWLSFGMLQNLRGIYTYDQVLKCYKTWKVKEDNESSHLCNFIKLKRLSVRELHIWDKIMFNVWIKHMI